MPLRRPRLCFVALLSLSTCGRGPGARARVDGGDASCAADSTACGSECCAAPEVCLPDLTCGIPTDGGACGDPERLCGSTCCAENTVCARDATGAPVCAPRCAVSSECPASAPCCALLTAPSGSALAYGACVANSPTATCRCASTADCPGGACAPRLDARGAPTRPFVCVADDCGPYRGCASGCACAAGFCCLAGASGNAYCARACVDDTTCGGGVCDTFTDTTRSACARPTACGPR